MEYFELLDEDGKKTGQVKEREAVHRDGDLHGGSHMWIVRDICPDGDFTVLLQKRSPHKDSFPGCLDMSSAGHVAEGETFLSTAIRELEEELGICVTPDQLHFLFQDRTGGKYMFHGKLFWNEEIHHVYLVDPSVCLEGLRCQKEEIETVVWQKASLVADALSHDDPDYCIDPEEFTRLMQCVAEYGRKKHGL